ncbi:type I-E CRISPR-associated endoribonuclease Cas2 [Lactobacillus sp. CBA3605]|uniref:type I-E CRISPR-associated endoribonuclease Cas2e n=1 Tax=Lactobacillus sp. CBA3605 TaxID=2099788 RepID=UPI000CFB213C|nr:type I-E CRISPR-associated endoribonuclease Cas2e [Lactobacillus sp. CBA3605]AVK61556.1 type I-E CRISPR-associated endoribonuclease Cas2 [Lactobacillus sp. CBA3605]
MIVITLTKVPKSLQGDLTKWYQEIQTGVYVGNVSARIRDALWDRIMQNIGRGEATMVYNANNEFGYQFKTTRQDRAVLDFDGVPLMMHLNVATGNVKHGFSDAAKFHRAKVMTRKVANRAPLPAKLPPFVTIDLETTGLDAAKDAIISIGAVRRLAANQVDHFYQLIQVKSAVPKKITALTQLTSEILSVNGVSLAAGLQALQVFVGDLPIVGYNLRFDELFLTTGFEQIGQADLPNQWLDLLPMVKKSNKFLDNYRLATVLSEYGIENNTPHNALSDATATFKLADKLIENRVLKI